MLSVVIGCAACQSKNVELSPLAMLNCSMLNLDGCAKRNVEF